jgi:hypothetical protein
MARKAERHEATPSHAQELKRRLALEANDEEPADLALDPRDRAEDDADGFFGMRDPPEQALMDRQALEFLGDVPADEAGPVQLTYMLGLAEGVPVWVRFVGAYTDVSGIRGGRSVERIADVAKATRENAAGPEGAAGIGAAWPETSTEAAEDMAQDGEDVDADGFLAGWGL